MSLTLDPQSQDYGTVFSAPEISVDVVESDGLDIRGVANFIDSTNTTVSTESFEAIGRHRFQPNLSNSWNEAADGAASVQLTVTSYEEIQEEPINGSSNRLYVSPSSVKYTGYQVVPTIFGYDSTKMELQGTTAANNVGTYTIRVRPLSGYYWSTPPAGVDKYGWITLTWQITKADGYMCIAGVHVSGNNYYNITMDSKYDSGTWSTIGSTGKITQTSYPNSNIMSLNLGQDTIYGTCNGKGTTSATFSVAESANYTAATATVRMTCNFQEVISSLPVPSSLTYNGTWQSPRWTGYDSSKMGIQGDTKEKDVGTYYAGFYPYGGYVWWDGTSGVKEVAWTIESAYTPPAPVYSESVTMAPSSVTVSYMNDVYGYVTFENNTSKTLDVRFSTSTSGYGPHASFNMSDTRGSIWASATLSPYHSVRAKIFAGMPPSSIGRDCYINWEIKENGATIETKRLSVINT